MGHDHLVDEAPFGSDEGIGKTVFIVLGALRDLFGIAQLAAIQNLYRAARAHDGDFGGGPGIAEIAAQVLGGHHHIGPAIGLAGQHRDLGHGRLAIGEQQLGPVLDNPAIFLADAGQKARHIDKGQDRNFKGIAEPDKARGFAAGIDIQTACQHDGLVGHNAHRLAFDADESGDDIGGEILLNLEEIALVGNLRDQFFHVVGLVRIVGHQRVQAGFQARRIIEERADRGLFAIVQRQEVDQAAGFGQRFDVILEGTVGDAGLLRMGRGTAQFLGADHLVRHGLDHIGAGDKHVRGVLHHEDEVGHRRGIDRPARAGPHDQADLRHDSGRQDVALEHLAIGGKRPHAFLDARAAGIVDADHGRAVLYGHVHDLADLRRVRFRDRAAQNGKVLAEDIDHAAIDGAPAGDNAITGVLRFLHVKIGAAVGDKHVEFFERAFVKQKVDPFTGAELALRVLGRDTAGPAAGAGDLAAVLKLLQDVFHCVPSPGFRAAYRRRPGAESTIEEICKVWPERFVRIANTCRDDRPGAPRLCGATPDRVSR